jgi:hypothetical protein
MANENIPLCTWKDCTKAATHSFRWDWGDEGKSCPECVPLINQCAEALGRQVSINPLQGPAGEPPLERTERTNLIAARLSAEAELKEVQLRGHQLYSQNVDLSSQVQTHVMRAREHEGIVRNKDEQIERLTAKLEQRERELAAASSEVQRLNVLVPFVGAPPTELQPAVPAKNPLAEHRLIPPRSDG